MRVHGTRTHVTVPGITNFGLVQYQSSHGRSLLFCTEQHCIATMASITRVTGGKMEQLGSKAREVV